MTPALEYLIRSDLIRQWFSAPCSLFLTRSSGDKLVVTISEEFKPSDKFSVKHWNLATCVSDQVLPSMTEYSVPKKEIFKSPHLILSHCRPIWFEQELIRAQQNSYRAPMSKEIYQYYFDGLLVSPRHRYKRLNWLWRSFVSVYNMPGIYTGEEVPNFCRPSDYEIAEMQRGIVSSHMKRYWQYWQKWQHHMLLDPAELFFHKEYQ